VDGKPLPDAVPGPITARMKARFDRATAGQEPDFAHWLTLVDAR